LNRQARPLTEKPIVAIGVSAGARGLVIAAAPTAVAVIRAVVGTEKPANTRGYLEILGRPANHAALSEALEMANTTQSSTSQLP